MVRNYAYAVLRTALLVVLFRALVERPGRRREMEALAAGLGWHYDGKRDRAWDDSMSSFAAFHRGHGRVALHTVHGKTSAGGFPIRAGDFQTQRMAVRATRLQQVRERQSYGA